MTAGVWAMSVQVWVRARWGLGACKSAIFPCKYGVFVENPVSTVGRVTPCAPRPKTGGQRTTRPTQIPLILPLGIFAAKRHSLRQSAAQRATRVQTFGRDNTADFT